MIADAHILLGRFHGYPEKTAVKRQNMVRYGLNTLDVACCLSGYPFDIFNDHFRWMIFA